MTLMLIQGHRSARKHKILQQVPHKVFNWLGWNLVYSWDLLVWWSSYSFYHILIFVSKIRECPPHKHSQLARRMDCDYVEDDFKVTNTKTKQNKTKLLVFRNFTDRFLSTWYDERTTKLCILVCLTDLDLHSRSQLYKKVTTFVFIFS